MFREVACCSDVCGTLVGVLVFSMPSCCLCRRSEWQNDPVPEVAELAARGSDPSLGLIVRKHFMKMAQIPRPE